MKQIFHRLSLVFLCLFVIFSASCATSSGSDSDDSASLPPEETYQEVAIDPLDADFSKSARAFVAGMGAGWNLGNTLDAFEHTGLASETSWGQPMTTQAMMKGLYVSGIRTVRIPVSWHNHMNKAFTIDAAWMARVKEVVDYAMDEGLYVIINIHHDNAADGYYPDKDGRVRAIAYAERVWKQVALQFRNYDEKLIFEFLNEPRLVGYSNEWGWSDTDSNHVMAAGIIGEMEQAALTAVRATGSNNADRYVMITPYVASPWAAISSKFVIPEDTAGDKIILSAHAYTPYSFAMQDPGERVFTDSHKAEINTFKYLGISSIKHRPVKVLCDKKIRVVHEKNPLTDIEPSD